MTRFKQAPEPAVPPSEELDKVMERFDKYVEQRLEICPLEWRTALIEVLDTFETCGFKLMASQGFAGAYEAIQLARLVMERKARLEDLAERERQREEAEE